MTMDGAAVWLTAPSGNGVFETRGGRCRQRLDRRRSRDGPSAVTGSTYRVEFGVVGGVTTHSVLENGAPTAAVDVPYVDGQAIEFDGLSVTVRARPPRATRSISCRRPR